MNNEYITKIAEALFDYQCPCIRTTPEDDKFYQDVVRFVITQMREPSPELLSYIKDHNENCTDIVPNTWRSMIDTLLGES